MKNRDVNEALLDLAAKNINELVESGADHGKVNDTVRDEAGALMHYLAVRIVSKGYSAKEAVQIASVTMVMTAAAAVVSTLSSE